MMVPITLTIPSDHPIFRALGGADYQAAAADVVGQLRNNRAVQMLTDPADAKLMARMLAAPSGSDARCEAHAQLKARGCKVQDIDYEAGRTLDDLVEARIADMARMVRAAA